MPRARLGAHAPGPIGGVVRSARRVVEALATPLVPGDYLDLSTRCAPGPTCAAGSSTSAPRPRMP
jgi:hypothetical protein